MKLYRVGPFVFSDELYHYGVKGQKWGVKNGPPYPLSSDVLAHRIEEEAAKREPSITRAVVSSVQNSGGKMYGLEHRLKTYGSIKRKIQVDAEEKGISESKAASGIKDAVRYTSVADDDKFVDCYISFKKQMESRGYRETRCRNYFQLYREGKAKHKSVQSVFSTDDGYLFEVQFQTPSSQKAKDKKVPIYEERRKSGLSAERQRELESQMERLADEVAYPRDISRIKSH